MSEDVLRCHAIGPPIEAASAWDQRRVWTVTSPTCVVALPTIDPSGVDGLCWLTEIV